jgi:hypothetical protein
MPNTQMENIMADEKKLIMYNVSWELDGGYPFDSIYDMYHAVQNLIMIPSITFCPWWKLFAAVSNNHYYSPIKQHTGT